MTLYEYLKNCCEYDTEITTTDKEYDTETYFYSNFDESDDWQNCMIELSKLVEIEVLENCVSCNFSEIIEKHIEELNRELFNNADVDDVMEYFDNIISGYVSEEWMENFVEILKK